jgi:hypothetical protein
MQFSIHSLSLSPSEAKANPAPVTPPRPVTAQEAQEQWREILRSFYPDILTRPYCVPHVYFNRVPYEVKEIGASTCLSLKRETPHQRLRALAGGKYQRKTYMDQRQTRRSPDQQQ